MQKIIFHYPGPFHKEKNNAERIRPPRMLEAFRNIGFDVTEITGTSKQRKFKLANLIKTDICKFDFIYSENRTLPISLTGNAKIPNFLLPDFKLFRLANKVSIPTGIFYRDIFWKFPFFKKRIGLLKYYLSIPLYKQELSFYQKYISVLFTPSSAFQSLLPAFFTKPIYPLPPGTDILPIPEQKQYFPLKLIYTGAITPPVHNISQVLKDIKDAQDKIELTIITRKEEFEKNRNVYDIPNNVKVIHKNKDEIPNLLVNSHIAIICDGGEYGQFALSMKLFEAISAGLPVVYYGKGIAASFIKQNNIGWIAAEKDQKNFFIHLIKNPKEIEIKQKNVLQIRDQHTWEKRAEKVAEVLSRSYEYYS